MTASKIITAVKARLEAKTTTPNELYNLCTETYEAQNPYMDEEYQKRQEMVVARMAYNKVIKLAFNRKSEGVVNSEVVKALKELIEELRSYFKICDLSYEDWNNNCRHIHTVQTVIEAL